MVEWTQLRARLEAEAGLAAPAADLTVERLAQSYLADVSVRCAPRPREANNSHKNVRTALAPLRGLYGSEPAAALGPRELNVVQRALSEQGLSAATVNDRIAWCRSMYRWAVSRELVPSERLAALETLPAVRPTQYGTPTRRPPVRAADPADVDATLAHLPRVVADAVRWLRLTAARPGEAARLHASEIEEVDGVRFAVPRQQKSSWRGQDRPIAIGPRAWLIMQRHLRPGLAVFRTPLGGAYSSQTLTQAIRRGVQRALEAGDVRRLWSAHQLRHLAATECAAVAGDEQLAQRLLRHAHVRTTRGYLHCDAQLREYVLAHG